MVHNFVKFCTWNILLQQACSVFSAKLYGYVHFTIQLKLWLVSQKCWQKVGVTSLLGVSITNVRTLNQIHMFHILCMYKLYTRVCIHVIYTFVSPSMGLLVIIWGSQTYVGSRYFPILSQHISLQHMWEDPEIWIKWVSVMFKCDWAKATHVKLTLLLVAI